MPRVVHVVFRGTASKEYSYLTPSGDSPRVGDLVAVYADVQILDMEAITDLRIGRVVWAGAESSAQTRATKQYLYLIPAGTVRKRMAANRARADKVRAKREARARLDELVKSELSVEIARKLAKTNKEARDLLSILEDD